MPLGEQRDEQVLERLAADLHRARDVVRQPPRERGARLRLLRRYGRLLGGSIRSSLSDAQSLHLVEHRSATSSLLARGTCRSPPSAVTIVTSFSAASKPMPGVEMSLTTTASSPLRSSLPRP